MDSKIPFSLKEPIPVSTWDAPDEFIAEETKRILDLEQKNHVDYNIDNTEAVKESENVGLPLMSFPHSRLN